MNKFQYEYVKAKYGEKAKIYIKADDMYKDIAENVEARFDTKL